MYPILRLVSAMRSARRAPPLGIFDTHVSRTRCWPWDLDPWMDLNNGRTLTLFDAGRVGASIRTGLAQVLRANRWGMTMAGSSMRYRRRITLFQTVEMRTRLLGWDARFLYMEQSMWRGGEALNQMLARAAVTGPGGIVPPEQVAQALGVDPVSPPLPDWVRAWIEAESQRPWPPQGAVRG